VISCGLSDGRDPGSFTFDRVPSRNRTLWEVRAVVVIDVKH